MSELLRRDFLKQLASTAGAAVILPSVSACGGTSSTGATTIPVAESDPIEGAIPPIPATEPEAWDPIAFNRERGNAGAIPESYRAQINGEDGARAHLGKHLPFFPELEGVQIPAGYVAIMCGNPDEGYPRHPSAAATEASGGVGHWYDWIRIRSAEGGPAEELESTFTSWPAAAGTDGGAYRVLGGGDLEGDGGRNTIYLARLPAHVQSGQRVRVVAHCSRHGEYVDFLTLG